MEREEALGRLARARVAHLATVRTDKSPHVVVVTFASIDDSIVTAVDQKPKTTKDLQRLRNITHEPRVSLLADAYDDHWNDLWWVRVDGRATVLEPGAERERAVAALVRKYHQYADSPPHGPVVSITIERVNWWSIV